MIRLRNNNYEIINVFKYSKVHYLMIINSSEFINNMSDDDSRRVNPTDSVGPQDTDSIVECNLTLEIMDSREYYSNYGDACGAVKVGLESDRQLLSPELPSESDSTEMETDKAI